MLTIKNLTKRTVVFNLPHEVACSDTVCTCSRVKAGVQELDKTTGDRKVRAVNQRLAHAITLFPKGAMGDDGKTPIDRVSGLLNGVGRVPEVAQAKARGEIEVILESAETEEKAPKVAAAPPSKDKTTKAAAAAVKE